MFKSKCSKCGCTGIHACMGTPGTPMSKIQLAELEKAIISIRKSENQPKRNEDMSLSISLTKEQIKQLAIYAGYNVQDISGSDSSTEYVIRQGTINGESGEPEYNGLLAYDKDYPEDGAIPLE